MSTEIIVMTKMPEKGKVKTRLAQTVGDDVALEIYKKLLSYTRDVLEGSGYPYRVYYGGTIPDQDLFFPSARSRHLQPGGDLGNRMLHAFQETLDGQEVDKALIIGCDCPYIHASHIQEGVRALQDNDLVVGPASDGGYYLLGMKRVHAELFTDKPWSADNLLTSTLEGAQELGLSVYRLKELSDLDYWEDVPDVWKKEWVL